MALADSDGFTVRCDAKVERVEAVTAANEGADHRPPRYRVLVGGDAAAIEASAVIAAGEAFANADAVADIAPEVAAAGSRLHRCSPK